MWEPTNPAAPVTSTRMGCLLPGRVERDGEDERESHLGGQPCHAGGAGPAVAASRAGVNGSQMRSTSPLDSPDRSAATTATIPPSGTSAAITACERCAATIRARAGRPAPPERRPAARALPSASARPAATAGPVASASAAGLTTNVNSP